MSDFKLGDIVEFRGTICDIIFYNNKNDIALNYSSGCSVIANSTSYSKKTIMLQGFKDNDPCWWTNHTQLELIKKLEEKE